MSFITAGHDHDFMPSHDPAGRRLRVGQPVAFFRAEPAVMSNTVAAALFVLTTPDLLDRTLSAADDVAFCSPMSSGAFREFLGGAGRFGVAQHTAT